MKSESPAFRVYPKDVLSDATCSRMSNEEFGAYWRLLMHSWLECGLPNDLADLALMLPRTSSKEFDRIWRRIGRCFVELDGRLVQERLEEERKKQADYRSTQAAAGRLGATKRKGRYSDPTTDPSRVAIATLENTGSESLGSVQPKSSFPFPYSVSNSEHSSLRAREAPSPAWTLAAWFYRAAVEAKVISAVLDVDRRTIADLEHAEALLAHASPAEVELRAQRLFAMKRAGKLRRQLTLGALREAWDWAEIGTGAPEKPENEFASALLSAVRDAKDEGRL